MNRPTRTAILAALMLAAPIAVASEAPDWPAFIALIDDTGTAKIESGFSVERIVDCPDAPNPAPITAYEAGPGTLTIYPEPDVGPPLVVRYGARSFTERAWPEMVPALILIGYVSADGARFDGGFSAGVEDCVEWVRP